ncbi:hypothetical protein CWS02_07300 [Enterobacter sp. EA-1]|nr:hypothetical protein CWS02_07300 [Enterobacter sp. EA-1]
MAFLSGDFAFISAIENLPNVLQTCLTGGISIKNTKIKLPAKCIFAGYVSVREKVFMRKGKIIVASMMLFCVLCFAAVALYFLVLKVMMGNRQISHMPPPYFRSLG